MLPNVSCRQNPLGTEFSTDLNGHRHLDHGLSRLQVVRNQFRAVALGYGWGCGGVGGVGEAAQADRDSACFAARPHPEEDDLLSIKTH